MEKEKQTENINIKMSPSLKQELKKVADYSGLKIGPYIKMLIMKDINEKCHLRKENL